MAMRDATIAMVGVLVVGQTIGLFLRSVEDGFKFRKSLRITLAVWSLYSLYLFAPFILSWDIWTGKWEYAEALSTRRKVRLTVVTLVVTYPLVILRCAKRATAVYSLFRPSTSEPRQTLLGIAVSPVKDGIANMSAT